jgi:plastocyanin
VNDRKILGPGQRMVAAGFASAALVAGALGLALVAPVLGASHEVTIVDGAFQPATLTVVVGEPVTWTNTGSSTHTVTLDDGSLDSGSIAPGGTFGHTFEAPGTFGYHCAIHGSMVGTIVVQGAPVTAAPGGSPAPASGGDGGGVGGFLGTAVVVVLVGGVAAFLVRAFARGRGRPPS